MKLKQKHAKLTRNEKVLAKILYAYTQYKPANNNNIRK